MIFPDMSDINNMHRNCNQALNPATKGSRQCMSSDSNAQNPPPDSEWL